MMERGFIKLWRKTLDSGLLANGPAWQLFGYLLLKTTHKPYRQIVGGVAFDLQPGEVVFGRKKAAEELNLGEQQIRTALKLLEKLEILTSRSTNRCTVISFVNWGTYQEVQPAAQPTANQHLTSNQPAPNQHLTTNKNIEYRTKNIDIPPLPPLGESDDSDKKPKKPSSAHELKAMFATLPDGLRQAMEDFSEMRKGIKKPMTPRAAKLILDKLQRFYGEDEQRKVACIEQSIMNGWQGVFELKDEGQAQSRPSYAPNANGRSRYIRESEQNFDNLPMMEDGFLDWSKV